MRKIESLSIRYVGYKEPKTHEEVQLEILGLKTAIAAAKQRIAVLTQSVQLQHLMKQSLVEDTKDEETVPETPSAEKTE
jgi:hypothetical protein